MAVLEDSTTSLYRTVNISSELTASGNAAEVTAAISPALESEAATWGAGYTYSMGGDAEQTAESMGSVVRYLPLSAFIIVLLLIIQFNSARKTLMVVLTIPLAITGTVLGLLIFRAPFGFMPFLGVISLAGIVINNAIVLLDRIAIEIKEFKRTEAEAIFEATQQRLRPILLTTATTVLGMMPLLWGGTAMFVPMAITIMFGLAFATALTLLVVPVLYSLFFRVSFAR